MKIIIKKLYKYIDNYMTGMPYSEKTYISELEHIDKKLVVKIANKYFGDNYLAFHSKIGFPKHKQLDKPINTPLNFNKKDRVSEMAAKINGLDSEQVKPEYINFKRDVVTIPLKENFKLIPCCES